MFRMDSQNPDIENLHYLDEYPHLEERLRLRRMGQLTLFSSEMGNTVVDLHRFQTPKVTEIRVEPPDQPA